MTTLDDWFRSRIENPPVNPITEVQEMLQKEHSGSGMRNHLELLGAKTSKLECFCQLKKYGKEIFDPAKMPLSWIGCKECRS